jgi:hypothetical protein
LWEEIAFYGASQTHFWFFAFFAVKSENLRKVA